MYWIGLMSGTSADAIDAALVRIGERPGALELVAFGSLALEEDLRRRVHALSQGPVLLRDLLQLDVELGERFAEAAQAVLRESGVPREAVRAVGSHGQTVGHYPEPEVRATLQLGSAAVIHERTGLPVFSDFRRADMAAGGQGAPLTPFLHHACFAVADECRGVLNLGGFANLTCLPDASFERAIAFDSGPANALLDRAARWATNGAERFDRDGEGAARGRVDPLVLEALLADPYFSTPPPKSTGHEHFGASFFEQARERVRARGGGKDDVLATLAAITVESIARAAERFFPAAPARWLVYGGGVRNRFLIESLRQRLGPAELAETDAFGVPAHALEAMAFALLAWAASRGLAANLPQVTGASHPTILGTLTPPFVARGMGPGSAGDGGERRI